MAIPQPSWQKHPAAAPPARVAAPRGQDKLGDQKELRPGDVVPSLLERDRSRDRSLYQPCSARSRASMRATGAAARALLSRFSTMRAS